MKQFQRDSSLQGSSFSDLLSAKKLRFTKLKPLSILESPKMILSTFEAQELHPTS